MNKTGNLVGVVLSNAVIPVVYLSNLNIKIMKATSIPAHEASFETHKTDSHGKKFILTPGDFKIKGSNDTVTIVDCLRENNAKAHYYQEQTEKRKIIVHYTMGYLKGEVATLTTQHVSVPFLIARNGKIYNLFASKYWSYHLGRGTVGGNTAMSKECIGIELSNIGPLRKIGNNLVTDYSDTDVYCTLDETQHYTKLATKYRGFEYYAKFTENQYASLIQLLRFLCGKYDLPKTFLGVADRYKLLSESSFVGFKGIASHVNCRLDKTDIGPAFDWDKVINGVV
jgi:N-acetylmuramoyl-L-alanine amidase